jgi:hypothetical protein
MKIYIIFFYFTLLLNAPVFSQYIPNWLKMGMGKDEIENNLNGEKLTKRDGDLYLSASLDDFVIYQYNIDKINGLNQYWIIGIYFNIFKILEDYNLFYGKYVIINENFWWFDINYLPENVKAITVGKKGNAVNIAYFFYNSE